MTPLLRVLVAIPTLGNCSTRNTSSQRRDAAHAIAHPTTPPPMIRMFARSITLNCHHPDSRSSAAESYFGRRGMGGQLLALPWNRALHFSSRFAPSWTAKLAGLSSEPDHMLTPAYAPSLRKM